MPPTSSGLVSVRSSSTRSPRARHASAASAVNTMRPTAAPAQQAGMQEAGDEMGIKLDNLDRVMSRQVSAPPQRLCSKRVGRGQEMSWEMVKKL